MILNVMAIIVPGILTNDEMDYEKRLRLAEHVASLIQIDVVDGEFAKSQTVQIDTIKKYGSSRFLEIQLMVVKPLEYIRSLVTVDYVSRIIYPIEAQDDVNEINYEIRRANKQIGISLNPETPIEAALKLLESVDLLLLLAGKPGFSGQKLGVNTFERIRQAKSFAPEMALEIDIGVNEENAKQLAEAGVDFLVTSSAVYNAPDFYLAYEKLAKLASVRT